jgi:hypothetical protein
MIICPQCKGRATKLNSVNTGKLKCQQCDYEWLPPDIHSRRANKEKISRFDAKLRNFADMYGGGK